jgi:hypothetical protein
VIALTHSIYPDHSLDLVLSDCCAVLQRRGAVEHYPGRLMPIIGRPTREAMFVYTSAMVMGMPVLFSSTCAVHASCQDGRMACWSAPNSELLRFLS